MKSAAVGPEPWANHTDSLCFVRYPLTYRGISEVHNKPPEGGSGRASTYVFRVKLDVRVRHLGREGLEDGRNERLREERSLLARDDEDELHEQPRLEGTKSAGRNIPEREQANLHGALGCKHYRQIVRFADWWRNSQ
jgi:hypothetical protein